MVASLPADRCLFCGEAVGAPEAALIDVAVAVEAIDAASLLQDGTV